MARDNFLNDDRGTTARRARPPQPDVLAAGRLQFGATVYELEPGAHGDKLHMHYGSEEMFFVVSGTPTLRTGEGEERSRPATSSTAPRARRGSTRSRTRVRNRRGSSPSRPVLPGRRRLPRARLRLGRDPRPRVPRAGGPDKGIIARFDLPED